MKQTDFAKALQMKKRYSKLKKEFERNYGIIQPIRAIVINIDELSKGCSTDNQVYQKLARHVIKVMSSLGVERMQDKYCVGDLDGFINQSKIVGYLAATTKFQGVAYCQEKDFDEFNPYFGKIMAMERALYHGCDLNEVTDDQQTCNIGDGSNFMYIWPIPYGAQVSYFLDRCKKYFKEETK